MDWQALIAGALVAACSTWAVWMFLPATPRAWLIGRLGLKTPVSSGGACGGCSGCGDKPAVAGAPQVVKIVRRPPA